MSSLADLVSAQHVVVGLADEDAASVIRRLAGLLAASGHVEAGYADACVQRESTDPTGLPTAGAAVAIPHADPELVRRAAVAVAVPAQPIAFAQMGDPDVTVAADAVFLLALDSADGQLSALRQVAALVQDGDRLRSLVAAENPEQALAVLRAADQES